MCSPTVFGLKVTVTCMLSPTSRVPQLGVTEKGLKQEFTSSEKKKWHITANLPLWWTRTAQVKTGKQKTYTSSKYFTIQRKHGIGSHLWVCNMNFAVVFPMLRTRCVLSVEYLTGHGGRWISSRKSRMARGPMAQTGTSNRSLSVTNTRLCW